MSDVGGAIYETMLVALELLGVEDVKANEYGLRELAEACATRVCLMVGGEVEAVDGVEVRRVYERWLEVSGESKGDCRLTDKRRKLIKKNLTHFGYEALVSALEESHRSMWHREHQQDGLRGKWFKTIEGVEAMVKRARDGRITTGGEMWV